MTRGRLRLTRRIVAWGTPLAVLVVCVMDRIVLGPWCWIDCPGPDRGRLGSDIAVWAIVVLLVWLAAVILYWVYRLLAWPFRAQRRSP